MKDVVPRSEEELATALAAAVEGYAARGTGDRSLQGIQEGLHDMLYHTGSDGILELSVSQSRSTCITLLGIVIWVDDQTLGPLEAEFHLDKADGAVTAFTVRAGDKRISRRDAPSYPLESWRKRLRFIEGRPLVDEDWEHVLRHEFS
jgi:hypothetical protein